MDWWLDLKSKLFGRIPVPDEEIEQLINSYTFTDTSSGTWRAQLHPKVARNEFSLWLTHWMKQRDFQAVVTGIKSLSFLQDKSKRSCVCQFFETRNGVEIHLQYFDNGTHEENSPSDIFFQSILLELSCDLASNYFLPTQNFTLFPEFDMTVSIVDENTFHNRPGKIWVIFLRLQRQKAVIGILRQCFFKASFVYDAPTNSDPNKLILSRSDNRASQIEFRIGHNSDGNLLMHCYYPKSGGENSFWFKYAQKTFWSFLNALAEDQQLYSQSFSDIRVSIEVPDAIQPSDLEKATVDFELDDILPINQMFQQL